MTVTSVGELLKADRWALAEGNSAGSPSVIRFREPVLGPDQTSGYHRCLRILWGYAEQGSGALPDAETSAELEQFENHLCLALEGGGLAVLTAVLTFDGARQWVFYTADVPACGACINAMPQGPDPYPIELDAFTDREWRYLRDEILATVQRDA